MTRPGATAPQRAGAGESSCLRRARRERPKSSGWARRSCSTRRAAWRRISSSAPMTAASTRSRCSTSTPRWWACCRRWSPVPASCSTTGFTGPPSGTSWPERSITWINAVPAIISRLGSPGPDETIPSGIRFIRSASAPLPVATADRFEATTGIPVIETYGMTEAASQITAHPLSLPRRPGSVGLPVGVELRIVREAEPVGSTRQAPEFHIGHVEIRGPSVVGGYVGNEHRDAFAPGRLAADRRPRAPRRRRVRLPRRQNRRRDQPGGREGVSPRGRRGHQRRSDGRVSGRRRAGRSRAGPGARRLRGVARRGRPDDAASVVEERGSADHAGARALPRAHQAAGRPVRGGGAAGRRHGQGAAPIPGRTEVPVLHTFDLP